MKAILVETPGGPETLQLVELPTPEPGRGEARVRIEAAGVNFLDVYHRCGVYKVTPPIRIGQEGAGIVEAVGPGVDDLEPGDPVAWADVSGSYATHVVAPAAKLVPVPDGVSLRAAAASMLQGMTADYLSRDSFKLTAQDTCLVHAAAGGVGLLLCQLAKQAGARVLGTVSTEAKAERARAAGCDEPILYTKVDFAEEVKRLTHGAGVSVVYDSVGKTTFDKSLTCLRRRGTMVTFGQSSGVVPPFDVLRLSAGGSLFLTRPKLGDHTATPDELRERASRVLGGIQRGRLKIAIDEEIPLQQAARAHTKLESRATTGKLLLIP